MLLVSCQTFRECPESVEAVKEHKIAIAVDMCLAAQDPEEEDREEEEDLDHKANLLVKEAFDYIIDQFDLTLEHRETLRMFYSGIDVEECEVVEAQLRLGIIQVVRSMKDELADEPLEEI